jgi:anti-anti-sigma factor
MYDLHDIVLQVTGSLDAFEVAAFDECVDAAIAEEPRRLIVELSALESMDEHGLRAVIGARDRAARADVDFVLDSPSAAVTALLDDADVREGFFVR